VLEATGSTIRLLLLSAGVPCSSTTKSIRFGPSLLSTDITIASNCSKVLISADGTGVDDDGTAVLLLEEAMGEYPRALTRGNN
jgi:hypothetical protein